MRQLFLLGIVIISSVISFGIKFKIVLLENKFITDFFVSPKISKCCNHFINYANGYLVIHDKSSTLKTQKIFVIDEFGEETSYEFEAHSLPEITTEPNKNGSFYGKFFKESLYLHFNSGIVHKHNNKFDMNIELNSENKYLQSKEEGADSWPSRIIDYGVNYFSKSKERYKVIYANKRLYMSEFYKEKVENIIPENTITNDFKLGHVHQDSVTKNLVFIFNNYKYNPQAKIKKPVDTILLFVSEN